MEKEGLNCCINFLKDSKLEMDVLVTDRHKQINKWLQEAHPVTRFAKRGLIHAQFQDTLFIAIC